MSTKVKKACALQTSCVLSDLPLHKWGKKAQIMSFSYQFAVRCYFIYIFLHFKTNLLQFFGRTLQCCFPATLQNCFLDCKTLLGWVGLKQLSLHFWVSLSFSCQSELSLKKWGHSFDGTASQLKSDVLMSVNLVLRPALTVLTVIAFHRQHTEIFQPQFSVTKHNHESAFL